MAIGLKDAAKNCLGIAGAVSVLRDVFGYFSPPGQTLSLRRQLELLQQPGFNVNAILVADDQFVWADLVETQYAIQFMRDIYGKVNLCVRKIRWQAISSGDAGGYATIDSGSEAFDLTDDWNGPDDGYLDVFIVRAMNGADGWSAVGGPCSKDDKDEMTGSVVSLNGDKNNSGNTFAHEIGHYLGLDHIADVNNFIGNGGDSNSNTGIFDWQGTDMKKHCYVNKNC